MLQRLPFKVMLATAIIGRHQRPNFSEIKFKDKFTEEAAHFDIFKRNFVSQVVIVGNEIINCRRLLGTNLST